MSTRPERVEILDPVDRWLHLGTVLGGVGALATGVWLETGRPVREAWTVLHGVAAAVAAGAWLLHLVRVCLAWLEGGRPWGLLPRPGDAADLVRGLGWATGLLRRSPGVPRFTYRERVPYAAFLVALPLLVATGWGVANPGAAVRVTGPGGLVAVAAVHAATGALLVPFLLWHVYFAHLRPGALFWNGSWVTGRMPWTRVVRMWPGWARQLEEDLTPGDSGTEEELPSVQSLLERGNRAAGAGQWAEAEETYREALELYPGYPQALFNLGVVRLKAGDPAGARDPLVRLLEQDPFNPVAPRARELLARIEGGTRG